MGKSLIQQARGRGGPTYRARSFAYAGEIKLRPESTMLVTGKVLELIKCPGHTAPLMAIEYEDGEFSLLPAPEFVRVGDKIQAGPLFQFNF